MHRFHPTNLRAAWWAVRAARRTRRMLERDGLDAALAPPPPPPLAEDGELGVRAALRRHGESCLVNSIVLQAWEAAHGRRRDLVVGITGPDRFHAHAWLDGDPVPTGDDPGIDPSGLVGGEGRGWTGGAPEEPNGEGEDGRVDERAAMRFSEILRRSAPSYQRRARGSPGIR